MSQNVYLFLFDVFNVSATFSSQILLIDINWVCLRKKKS